MAAVAPILKFIESLGRPLVLGISGPQGSGKTTLVNQLVTELSSSLRVVAFSIDDIYLGYSDLVALGRANPDNQLLQHRGEPGTHDVELGVETLKSLIRGGRTAIPSYDKSKFDGCGDRVPKSEWRTVEGPFDIILFEGWCVGFESISNEKVREKWEQSAGLQRHALEHLEFVNEKLQAYSQLWDLFDALVWLNAEDIDFVYAWRLQQEHAMRAALGKGMTDSQVKRFVDGYMPAYELYIDGLMRGDLFRGKNGRQIMRVDYGQNREIQRIKKGVMNEQIEWE